MEVKISCSCGDLSYSLPVPLAIDLAKVPEETQRAFVGCVEESLHSFTNALLGAFLVGGPMAVTAVLIALKEAMIPFNAMNELVLVANRSEPEDAGKSSDVSDDLRGQIDDLLSGLNLDES